MSSDASPLGDRAPPSFADEYHRFLDYLNLIKHCDFDPLKVETILYAKDLEALVNESAFVDALFIAAHERKFCSTKHKRIGLVPHTIKSGDLVAIIIGADVPFVLRPTNTGRYELVGDCYIHGVMDGEALVGKHDQVGSIVLE